jgi:hypothetical protein
LLAGRHTIESNGSTFFPIALGGDNNLTHLASLQLLRDLNREVSAYHNMALALGGSSDCEQLRGELKRTRRKAQELASLNKAKLRIQAEE